LRADILPGRVARVPFTPRKEGSFEFACDVFCGSGHEDMGGVIKVRA
jgi:cytochrome c oxidase subunit 2